MNIVQHVKLDWFKLLPQVQDHLGLQGAGASQKTAEGRLLASGTKSGGQQFFLIKMSDFLVFPGPFGNYEGPLKCTGQSE